MKIKIATINRDLQTRASMNLDVIEDYAQAMTDGAEFPPVEVFSAKDGVAYLSDGFHRIAAAERAGLDSFEANLRQGSRLDALKAALASNQSHGLRRTNEDKRRCVEIALREFGGHSDGSLAHMCGVSDMFVSKMRRNTIASTPQKRVGRDGKSYPAKQSTASGPNRLDLKPESDPHDDASPAVKSTPDHTRETAFPADGESEVRTYDQAALATKRDVKAAQAQAQEQADSAELEALKGRWNASSGAVKQAFLGWLKDSGEIE